MNPYHSKLQASNEAFKNAEVKSNSFEEDDLPEGIYDLLIEKMTLKDNDYGLQLSWQFRIKGPSNINRCHFMNTPLEGEYIGITKTWLISLGYELETLTQIERVTQEIVEKQTVIKASLYKNKKGYLATAFKSVLFPEQEPVIQEKKEEPKVSDKLLSMADKIQAEAMDLEKADPTETTPSKDGLEPMDDDNMPF